MRIRMVVLIMIGLCLVLGCNEDITGIVVDAETGQPIEGAVVLAEWTKTTGVGLTSTESYKVYEALTDEQGKVRVDGILSPFVNEPHVSVYKKWYVLWNNEYIFPDWKKRTDFYWRNNYSFRLEKFNPEYSYNEHTLFVGSAIRSHIAGKKKNIIKNAYRWEELKALDERRKIGSYSY